MVKHTPFLSMISLLQIVFKELIFKLSHKVVMHFEVYEAMAVVSLKAICDLDKVGTLD
jgi:hypothetical protein